MSININEIADLLRLDEVSADVYIELLTHKELPIFKIAAFSGREKKLVQKALGDLLEKGFVETMENTKGEKVFRALSILQIEERLDREQEVLKNLKKFVLPEVQGQDQLEIMKYAGWEGIRHVYTEILEEAIKTEESIFAFESNIDKSDIGKIFLEKYIQRRIDHKIAAFVISPPNPEDKKYKNKYEGKFTKVKLLEGFSMDANINIVGELVMTFSTDCPRGTLRRNRAEANTWRTVFQIIWDQNS